MRLPRRYRVALLAYPAGYRVTRGPELAATLADGDDDRGRPSMREAGALAGRGLAMRLGAARSGEGLLVVAAVLILATLLSGFAWAERVYLLGGTASVWSTGGPGFWWTMALGVCAWVVLAAGPLGAAGDPRRRRIAVALTPPLFLLVFSAPGRLVIHDELGLGSILAYLEVVPHMITGNGVLTLPALTLATWVALRGLRPLSEAARRRALAAALVVLGSIAVVRTLIRPDFPGGYADGALADLRTATFLAAAAVLVALAALVRLRPRRAPAAGRGR